MANINEENEKKFVICDHFKIELHGKNFSDEINWFLKKYEMTQKELALRLGLSVKHINSILNDEIGDVFVSVLEGLEYAFRIPSGALTKIYHEYANRKISDNSEKIKFILNSFGINFLIEHPELAAPFNIKVEEEMSPYVKLMRLKKFYGVSNLEDYKTYLQEHILAEDKKYINKPNTYVWIRFCELSIDYDNNNIGVFRKSVFDIIMRKTLNIMSNPEITFFEKIKRIKKFLATKGIVLVTKPFIENSFIRGITIKKGGKRYIFLSDMLHCEPFIFFTLLHEIVHCYFPYFKEEEIDKKVIEEYNHWEKNDNQNPHYKAIYDAINIYDIMSIKDDNANSHNIQRQIFEKIQQKYPFVTFDSEEGNR